MTLPGFDALFGSTTAHTNTRVKNSMSFSAIMNSPDEKEGMGAKQQQTATAGAETAPPSPPQVNLPFRSRDTDVKQLSKASFSFGTQPTSLCNGRRRTNYDNYDEEFDFDGDEADGVMDME